MHATCVSVFVILRKGKDLKRSGMDRYEAHKGESQSGKDVRVAAGSRGVLIWWPTAHPLGQVISSPWASFSLAVK